MSDNGPQFNFTEMKEFRTSYNFTLHVFHTTLSQMALPKDSQDSEKSADVFQRPVYGSFELQFNTLSLVCSLSSNLLMGQKVHANIPQVKEPDCLQLRELRMFDKKHYDKCIGSD